MTEEQRKLFNSKLFIITLVLAALFFSLLNGLSHICNSKLLADENKEYYPAALVNYDVTHTVAPRIKTILKGNSYVTDTDIYEYRDTMSLMSPYAPILFFPFKYFTDSINTVLILSDFIFPIIFFFLFFLLFYFLSNGSKWLSLFFASLTILYKNFCLDIPPLSLSSINNIINSIFPFPDSPISHLITRKEAFIPTLVPFLIGLIFIYLATTRNRKSIAILAGLFYAINAYTYPYHFMYLSAGIGVLFLIVLVTRNRQVLQQLLILFISALIALVPFFITQLQLRELPQYYDVFYRHGVEIGRSFRWWHWPRYLLNIVLAIFIWVWGRKVNRKVTSYFVISFLLAAILVLNMQVFLGFAVQTDHWVTRDILWAVNMSYFIFVCYIFENFISKSKRAKLSIVFIAISLILSIYITSFKSVLINSHKQYSEYTIDSSITKSFEWLNHNTLPDEVVASPSLVTNYYIPAYTNNRIFLPKAMTSMAPEKEAIERFSIVYRIFNIDDHYFTSIMNPDLSRQKKQAKNNTQDKWETQGLMYIVWAKYNRRDLRAYTHPTSQIPQERYDGYEEIMNEYKSLACTQCINKYRIDYLYYGPQEKKISTVDFSEYEKVYDQDDVQIYKFVKK